MNAKESIAVVGGFVAGASFAFVAIKKTRALRRGAWWPSTKGRIIESQLTKTPDRRHTHFIVRYEFTVGERIESITPRLCGDWFWNNKLQQAFVDRYQSGQEVEVFYDPSNPRLNCLDRTDRSGVTAMWIIAIGGTTLASLLLWLEQLKTD